MTLSKNVLVSVNGVSRRYHRGRETIRALDDVSLSIRKGELLAIVGPSGSGKTTLAHIIGGLDMPQEGSVAVDGQTLKSRGDKVLSRYRNSDIGFVFQNFNLIPHYTAMENVAMPLVVAGMQPKERRERVRRYLKLVGLEARARHQPHELSGGERQRVGIARALVNQPRLIIADEPTGSLDSKHGDEIMRLLELLSHKQGIAVLMVTHDQALAARADRVVYIRDGRIVREELHAGR